MKVNEPGGREAASTGTLATCKVASYKHMYYEKYAVQ